MATLSQVYTTLGIGAGVTVGCYLGFGAAVRYEGNKDLTPRAWSRPRAVLKNVLSPPYCVSWMTWSLSQRYVDLLAGIPGTGTRRNGWSGPTLRTNLDGIVLLRYHSLLFKVAIVQTVLCMLLLLPLFYTSECDPFKVGRKTCEIYANNTDFEKLTIANVVPTYDTELVYNTNETVSKQQQNEESEEIGYVSLNDVNVLQTIHFQWVHGVTDLLWHEWIECNALRRVYYLESDYYEERLDELDNIRKNSDPEDPYQKVRPPYLPHPEMRETIPNVALHSVLYKLPSDLDTNFDNTSDKSLLERQLEAGVDIFDQCVPNQPGFTSSIAAITILPDASKLCKVWGKWYECGSKMRRLRYIKAHLENRRKMQQDGVKGLRNIVIDAPINVAKATAKAAVDGIETAKDLAADRIGTMKGIASDGIGKVSGEFVRIQSYAVDRIPGRSPQQQQQEQQQPAIRSNSSVSVASSIHEDEFFDANEIDINIDGENTSIANKEKENEEEENSTTLFSSLQMSLRQRDSISNNAGTASATTATDSDGDCDDIETGHPLNSAGRRFSSRSSVFHDTVLTADYTDESKEVVLVPSTTSESEIPAKECLEHVYNHQQDNTESNTTNGYAPGFGFKDSTKQRFDYDEFDPDTFAKWIGYSEETQLDQLIDTLDIEQLSVYAREMSQSASNPCVYGFGFRSLRLSSIEQLEVLLDDAWSSVRQANGELLLARADMFKEEPRENEDSVEDKKKNDDTNKTNGEDTVNPSNDNERNFKKLVRFSMKNTTKIIDGKQNKSERKEDKIDVLSSSRNSSRRAVGLRRRVSVTSTRKKYDLAQELVDDINAVGRTVEDGDGYCFKFFSQSAKQTGNKIIQVLNHPSYAVVTFTSRQAAIAARQCMIDGKAKRAWKQIENIPMTPLADAPPMNIFFIRGCCRPVTLTIPNRDKRTRKIISWALYIMFCVFYTVPLALVSQLLNPTLLAARYPSVEAFQNPDSVFFKILGGVSAGLVYSLFFSILPQVFKAFANFEGTASSKVKAEENAIRFYWYFMLVTAFTGTSLVTMLVDGIIKGASWGAEFKDILAAVAGSIVTQQAPTWLNWMLVRTGCTLPINYLLQFMTFLYGIMHCNWFNRVMRGGGPGGPPPFRIYIDSGVVFMCLVSLAPACPIIAPACLLYYSVFMPILRWAHIFVYRPYYDGGGSKLPIIHDIIISSLILGQILLGTLLLLKQSFFLGLYIVFLPIPTVVFSQCTLEKFLRCYEDAGLLQTSKLDGLSNKESMADREKYRRWLVDCHKASYVPICLSGGDDFLTNQPAVVVPIQREIEKETGKLSPRQGIAAQPCTQKGATFRRYIES